LLSLHVISESKIRPSLTEFRDFSVTGRGSPVGGGRSGWNRLACVVGGGREYWLQRSTGG
jgi:hypothetical protein